MTIKDIKITARVTREEKAKIKALASKCGLTQSEYLRQRALGYKPSEAIPDAFFSLVEKLDKIIETENSPEVEAQVLVLLKEMFKLIDPDKEVMKWPPQDSGL